jgi:hypothetical protein
MEEDISNQRFLREKREKERERERKRERKYYLDEYSLVNKGTFACTGMASNNNRTFSKTLTMGLAGTVWNTRE